MTPGSAKKIGSRKALVAATIGLIIAFLIITSFFEGNVFWLGEWYYLINIGIGVAIFYAMAYYFGRSAGYEILIKKKNTATVGVKYGVFTLLVSAFLLGWTGFVQEGMELQDSFWDSFEDYVYKPFFWITAIGIFPAIGVGILFGRWIKKSGANQE